ncbi:MAG: bifunctional methylenetetrahydrofolate dehydrogenase/methenyltetrahydrofolate cyclohydrolase FolD, partial [Synechococcaceae cyanobacterium SM1_2_3]|nr:bifunctional methylenetetrahydrofolate dehydrogenase/methenyltetrahydrofolate cyclohydrolase FolD [Synechococcaceae cyanobacterium SM1_2_3]
VGIAAQVAQLKAEYGLIPGLAVVLVGEDPASRIYVRNKGRQAQEAGIGSFEQHLPATTSQTELLAHIARLNQDPAVNGILVQLPLPRQINPNAIIEAIAVSKDVDGFHPLNAGLLAVGGVAMVPCTPLGCMMLLKDQLPSLAGLRALVLGRSNIVGKPMAALLLRENCTVTLAHSRTRNLADECRRADIVVAAIGQPEMVKGDWLQPGATVIDVGINRLPTPDGKGRLVGDVEFASAIQVAGAITPVPGGVGPMTIACLLLNTLTAACRQHGIAVPEVRPADCADGAG